MLDAWVVVWAAVWEAVWVVVGLHNNTMEVEVLAEAVVAFLLPMVVVALAGEAALDPPGRLGAVDSGNVKDHHPDTTIVVLEEGAIMVLEEAEIVEAEIVAL